MAIVGGPFFGNHFISLFRMLNIIRPTCVSIAPIGCAGYPMCSRAISNHIYMSPNGGMTYLFLFNDFDARGDI